MKVVTSTFFPVGRGMFGQPSGPVHGQHGFAGPGTAQDAHRSRAVADGQALLEGVEEHAPLGQGRIHDGGQGLIVLHHDKARLRFGRLHGRGKVLGIDRTIHLGFAGGQYLAHGVTGSDQEETLVGFDRQHRLQGIEVRVSGELPHAGQQVWGRAETQEFHVGEGGEQRSGAPWSSVPGTGGTSAGAGGALTSSTSTTCMAPVTGLIVSLRCSAQR